MQRNIEQWLNNRKITSSIIEQFKLSYANHQYYGPVIVIPVHDMEGNFLFNKYRRSPEQEDGSKYLYDKGAKVSLYAIHEAKNAQKIIITEGELDALALWSLNIPAVTGTGGALSFQKEWAPYFSGKEVFICYDNDNAGAEGMVKTLSILPHAKIIFIPEIAGIKDVSNYIERGGDMHELIRNARAFPDITSVQEDKGHRESMFLPVRFHEAYIENWKNQQKKEWAEAPHYTGDDTVTRAKLFPIPNLLKITRGKTTCLWHAERTPSLVYYPKTNSVYCFGCARYGDAIDVYRQLNNCSFKEAVSALQ